MPSLLSALLSLTVFKTVYCSIYAWDMVEVLLASEHTKDFAYHSALDDFQELFDEFAETHGLHYNKRNFRELETYYNGVQVAKYGLRNTNCEEFRQFLSGIKAQKYHLQYASVSCGPMTFSFCMAFSCDLFTGTTTARPMPYTAMTTTAPAPDAPF
ncbi:unnamed protein product [Cylicocyclus nassatus]|uniref:Cathepsin propeptide inhibitor domain-containing protein n=1 Tax=Cylicocyclus nassatus TaxID=53992 RepID=A0AA36M3T7_CYLNA|nr:unnamed protein product [Cylicocyclus nassatus]